MFNEYFKIFFFFINFYGLINIGTTRIAVRSKENCIPTITTSTGSSSLKGPYCSGQLIFQDNFDTLDFDKWQHENTLAGGGNWEFQWYTNNRSNSFTKYGILHIRPTLTSDLYGEEFLTSGLVEINGGAPADQCTNPSFFGCSRIGTKTHVINPVRSARLRTVESFNFKYGKLEVRAKLPSGDWLWPAIWLLPKRNAYGSWPASGEIDLLESRGNRDLINENDVHIGVKQFGTTLHYGPDTAHNGWSKAHFVTNTSTGKGFNDDFHVYSFMWTPEYIKFYLDDVEIGEFTADEGFFNKGEFPDNIDNPWKYSNKMAPFDQEFYVILNTAVGGVNGFFPDSAKNAKSKPWLNSSPHASTDFWNGRDDWLPTWNLEDKNNEELDFQIDYVRVYAL